MPRKPRLDPPGIPQHEVQRSNDRQCYLPEFKEIALREKCAVHAYALMTHYVHRWMTPADNG